MKWFYPIALIVAAGLALMPAFYLQGQSDKRYAGKMVRYDTFGADVKSLDPATCGDTTSASIQGNFYEGLYTYHFLKRPLEVVPQLAAEMPALSEDGRTYTIKLTPGVKYSRNACFGQNDDGSFKTRTVQARDFVLSFKRAADYHINTGLAWAFLSGRIVGLDQWREKSRESPLGDFSRYDLPVEGLRAVDDLTLQIKLTEPFPQMIYVLAMAVYAPVPREVLDYWLATEADGKGGRRDIAQKFREPEIRDYRHVVGTGPYLLTYFLRQYRILLERNPDFRDEYYPTEGTDEDKAAGLLNDAGKKVPFVDVMQFDYVAQASTRWLLFEKKQSDTTGIPQEVFESVIRPDKTLEKKYADQGIRLMTYESPAVYWLVFNMEDPVVGSSISLRRALCLAFDVENEIQVLYNGRGRRAVNILPNTFKGWAEAGPGPYYRLDVEAAKKLIVQAKEELAAAGKLVNGKIPELKLDLPGQERETYQMGEFCQQQFKKIGVELKVVGNDWPTLQEKVNNKRCQVYTMGWHADYPDAENFLQLFYSPNIAKGTNNANYANKEFDALYDKVKGMQDSPERTKMYAEMVNMINRDVPVLLLSEPTSFVLAYDWVKNSKPHPIGYGFGRYTRIDTDLRKKMGGR